MDRLDPSHIDLGLERMLQLMERLGNPHLNFRSVHIAGTNGKGSTAAFISTVLSKAGYKTGLYTSPHLEKFSERVKIDGAEISADEIDAISHEVKVAAEALTAGEPTYFEFTTALAFLYFARQGVDIAIIETGLGGRLDATNIITPLVSIITPISLDHMDYLGKTIKEVAAEKGGIIKGGTAAIIGRQEDASLKALEKIAENNRAELFLLGREFHISDLSADKFDYCGLKRQIKGIEISMYGDHQKENASLALACLERLTIDGYKINDDILRTGIKETFWPGRFEIISNDPAFILDGAHNPAAAKELAKSLKTRFNGHRGVFVLGFMGDKDVEAIVAELAPLASEIILTKPAGDRAFDPAAEAPIIKNLLKHSRATVIPDIKEAIVKGIMLAKERSFIIITGSLYMVGEARTILKGIIV
ncbi:MAG: folylpolyglutamate synthase/dihydrofolate synthase family protein [bacterium]|nr:folylpolyglutamate synthase/dihydrofolate synthase family protein [bacterium]